MSESVVLQSTMAGASALGARLLRNNIGVLPDRNGRPVRYGVGGNGGSDTIGLDPVVVTADMVGKTIAQFIAVEVKDSLERSEEEFRAWCVTLPDNKAKKHIREQISFIDMVRRFGGKAGMVRNPQELSALLGR